MPKEFRTLLAAVTAPVLAFERHFPHAHGDLGRAQIVDGDRVETRLAD
jgi:hypothetical protein